LDYLKLAQETARRIEERKKKEVCPKCGVEVHFQGMCYDCIKGKSIKKELLGQCACGAPAWDTDADGKGRCWCCLAIPGLFGSH
jgi:hypothetical protein